MSVKEIEEALQEVINEQHSQDNLCEAYFRVKYLLVGQAGGSTLKKIAIEDLYSRLDRSSVYQENIHQVAQMIHFVYSLGA